MHPLQLIQLDAEQILHLKHRARPRVGHADAQVRQPRPSHRPTKRTSSSRGTDTSTRAVDSEKRAVAASTPSRSWMPDEPHARTDTEAQHGLGERLAESAVGEVVGRRDEGLLGAGRDECGELLLCVEVAPRAACPPRWSWMTPAHADPSSSSCVLAEQVDVVALVLPAGRDPPCHVARSRRAPRRPGSGGWARRRSGCRSSRCRR